MILSGSDDKLERNTIHQFLKYFLGKRCSVIGSLQLSVGAKMGDFWSLELLKIVNQRDQIGKTYWWIWSLSEEQKQNLNKIKVAI